LGGGGGKQKGVKQGVGIVWNCPVHIWAWTSASFHGVPQHL